MSRKLAFPLLAFSLAAAGVYGIYTVIDGIFRGEEPADAERVEALLAKGLVPTDACSTLTRTEAARGRAPWDEEFSVRVAACQRPGYEGGCAGVAYALQWGTRGVTDRASALKFAACGCSKGYPTGCNVYATLFEHGHGVEQSYARAADIYEWACAQESEDACVNLGVLYERGLGRPLDPAKAAELYRPRCEAGSARACSAFAYLLGTGQGVTKDRARSLALHEAACDEGQVSSCNSLALALQKGQDRPRDVARARRLFEEACNGAYPPGCENYAAALLDEGRAEEALTFLVRGCTLETVVGRRSACKQLGRSIATGQVDRGRGLSELQEPCQRGLLDACVGAIAAQAVGEDLSAARREVEKACSLGWELACQSLADVAARPSVAPAPSVVPGIPQ